MDLLQKSVKATDSIGHELLESVVTQIDGNFRKNGIKLKIKCHSKRVRLNFTHTKVKFPAWNEEQTENLPKSHYF